MPKVKLSNGTILNFPDDMSQDQIKAIIQKKFPVSKNPENVSSDKPLENLMPEVDSMQSEKSFWEKIQDFISPESKVDNQGGPLVPTLFGRLPKDIPEYKQGTAENKQLINNMIDMTAFTPGLKTVVQAPFKLTLKNIGKSIIDARNKEKLFHSTQYSRLWDAAKKAGINEIKFNPDEINIEALTTSGTNKKYIRPLQKFLENPTLENAQTAQSDLGKLINSPQLSKEVLTSEETASKNAAEAAQKHIRDMMFRNDKGEVNQPLKKMYDDITASYEKNMVPYKSSAISKFGKGKMTAKQLLSKLKSGEFMATKGAAHPEIEKRDLAIELARTFGVPISIAGGLGMALNGKDILNKLMGKSD